MSTPTSDSSFDESDSRGQFFLSGSQPLELMESASESLAGRVGILELAGLSLREIQETSFSEPFVPTMSYVEKRSNSAKVPENLWEIIHRGSYPELQNPKRDWRHTFHQSQKKCSTEKVLHPSEAHKPWS